MTSQATQQLRGRIADFMDRLQVPLIADENSHHREDGVPEFSKHWCVRGNEHQGVFASFTDHDDVIEFGLLERNGETVMNLLHVTVVLDDDEAEMNSMSESSMEMNFDARISPEKQEYLENALRFFAEGLRSAAA